MKNKISKFILIFVLSLSALTLKAQVPTLTISTATANQGAAVTVPVNAENFLDIVGFQGTIKYDATRLTFNSISNWNADVVGAGVFLNTATVGEIRFVYNNYPAKINITTVEKFFDLNFTVKPTASGLATVTFSDSPLKREISNYAGFSVSSNWNNGSVTINVSGTEIYIANELGVAGDPVTVPVYAKELNNLVSMQWTILYDATKLTYTSCSGWNADFTGAVVINSSVAGQLQMVWNQSPTEIDIPATEVFFNLNFNIKVPATGVAVISWSDTPLFREITDNSENTIPTTWTNGSVTITPLPSALFIRSTEANPGDNVSVPVDAQLISTVIAFQWTIDYDETKLTYVGCTNWNANVSQGADYMSIVNDHVNGKLMFSYNGWGINAIEVETGRLFDMSFTVKSDAEGDACFMWSDSPTERELSNSNMQVVPIVWEAGCVTIVQPVLPTIIINDLTAVAGAYITVPITAFGITNAVAFQWTIDYDQTKLEYNSCTNWNADITANPGYATDNLTIVHDAINGKLMFAYNGYGSSTNYPITIGETEEVLFNLNMRVKFGVSGDACSFWSDSPTEREVSNTNLQALDVTWQNGCVITILEYYTWTGAVSTDWFDPENWSPKQVPTTDLDAKVPAGCPNYPIITHATLVAGARDLEIFPDAFVEISYDGELTVARTLINNNGVNGLTIKSDATGDGSLITPSAVVATIERYIQGNTWHMIFPSLNAVPHTVFTEEGQYINTNFYTYYEPNADYWNATTIYGNAGWTNVPYYSALPLTGGYMFNRYEGPERVYFQKGGTIHTTDKTFNVGYTTTVMPGSPVGGVTQAATYFDGWNLVGNPFPSCLDWDALTLGADVESGIYYYDGTVNNYKYYMQASEGTGTHPYPIVGLSANGGSKYVPLAQGFFVKAKASAGASSSFTISTNARVHYNTVFYKKSDDIAADLLRMNVTKNGFTDETIIRSLEEATDEHDGQFDAYKMFSWDNTKPQLYSCNQSNSIFAINSIPEITSTKTVPLALYTGQSGDYTFNFTECTYENVNIYFEDRTTSTHINVRETPSYTFNISQTAEVTSKERFFLHFSYNNLPYIENMPENITAYEEQYFELDLTNVFADNDIDANIDIEVTKIGGSALPEFISFENNKLFGTPQNDDVGLLVVNIKAVDNLGASVDFNLEVKVLDVNDPPYVNTILQPQSVLQDKDYSLILPEDAFLDIDKEENLVYSTNAPAWLSFDSETLRFTGKPSNAEVGEHQIKVIVTDKGNVTAEQNFVLEVLNLNDAPIANILLTDKSVMQNNDFIFTIEENTFIDIDKDDFIAQITVNIPEWLTYNADTKTISGTTDNSVVGNHTIEITATDNYLASTTQTFMLSVYNVNDAPIVGTILIDKTVLQDKLFEFTIPTDAFVDIDMNDYISEYQVVIPEWLTYDVQNKKIKGTPKNAEVGEYSIEIIGIDNFEASAKQIFTLEVINVNDAPVLMSSIANQTVTAQSTLDVTFANDLFIDIDKDDAITYSVSLNSQALPQWITFDAELLKISFNPTNDNVGVWNIVVTATDMNSASVSTNFEIEVKSFVSIGELKDGISIYPNPSKNGKFVVNVDNSKNYTYSVSDLNGKVIIDKQNAHKRTTLDLSASAKGIYILSIELEDKTNIVKQLIIN